MAILDYGAIAFKNGELISTGMFTPMEVTCGFSDKNNILPDRKTSFDGNNFVVIGTRQLVIGFYKDWLSWWVDDVITYSDESKKYETGGEWLSWTEFKGWKRYEKFLSTTDFNNRAAITIKPLHRYSKHKYFRADIQFKINYPGQGEVIDHYRIYFGYGIDYDWYKKTGRVQMYGDPIYKLQRIFRTIKDKFRRNR